MSRLLWCSRARQCSLQTSVTRLKAWVMLRMPTRKLSYFTSTPILLHQANQFGPSCRFEGRVLSPSITSASPGLKNAFASSTRPVSGGCFVVNPDSFFV